MFCPRVGPSLQAQGPRLQFCRRQIFHCKLRNDNCSFSRDWKGAVASRCFRHPTLSLASEQTLKRSEKIPGAPTWSLGEWTWLAGPSGLHRNSPQALNISSIRVFDQIRDPEIPITLRPQKLISSSSECSAQGQVLHCKRRNLGYSSTEGRSSTANLGNKPAVLPGTEQVQ